MDMSVLLFALLLMIHEVSVQTIGVEAAVGESVMLSCSSSRYEKDVFWRHNNTKTVYDIINGEEDFHDQETAYRGRVQGFPSEFKNGNYSIKLSDLQPSDTGTFICQIPNSNYHYVDLKIIEGRSTEKWTGTGNRGVMRRAGGISLFLLTYILLCSFAV